LARNGAALKAVVGFHSGLGTTRPAAAGAVRAKILTCIGFHDPIIPAEQRLAFEIEMDAAGVDWRMNVYGQAGHSFTNPGVAAFGMAGFEYHAESDRRSWAAMIDLFDEALGPPAA
jgi:dienelactone hydrolase